MNNKECLYLSYDGMTDPLGQSQVLPYIVGLSKKGYKFTLISCEKPERFSENKHIIEVICQENNIDWQPIFYTKSPPVFSTLWDVFQLNQKVKKLHKQKNFELIHCRSYITALIGLGFKKKHNVKFIFDMRGFWADERVDGGLWNLGNPVFKKVYDFFKKKEKEFIIYSDKIVSLTENGKQEMLSWDIAELASEKIKIIPCAADFTLFDLNSEEKKEQAKRDLGLETSQFVLSYLGSLGTWYLADEMLHFFSILKKEIPNAKFLFLTPDSKASIIEKAKKYNLVADDFIVRFSARKDIPKYAHASDFSIFFIKPSYSKKSSSPTKMGELMAMGIPLICNNNVGDVESIMEETKGGFCLNKLEEPAYEKVVSQLNLWQESSPKEIRDSSKQFYNLENGLQSYLSIYEELLK